MKQELVLQGRALLVAAYYLLTKKGLDQGLAQRILSFFSRTPPDGLFQLTQKKFFTGVSKNTSL